MKWKVFFKRKVFLKKESVRVRYFPLWMVFQVGYHQAFAWAFLVIQAPLSVFKYQFFLWLSWNCRLVTSMFEYKYPTGQAGVRIEGSELSVGLYTFDSGYFAYWTHENIFLSQGNMLPSISLLETSSHFDLPFDLPCLIVI